jgi:hypothetical protein
MEVMELKHTLIHNEFVHLECEMTNYNAMFIHAEIYVWTKECLKQYRKWFDAVLKTFYENGIKQVFVMVDPTNTKLLKFAKMFNFKYLATEKGRIFLMREIGE